MQLNSEYTKLLECPLCEDTNVDVIFKNKYFYGTCKKCNAESRPYNTKLEAHHGWNAAIGIHGNG
jgi:hypothetical protein